MTRKVLFFVAIVTICDAALIPISTNWPSSICARGYGGTAGNALGCLSGPCTSDIDYNFLFNLLYPDVRFGSLDETALGLMGPCTCNGRCDLSEYFRAGQELNGCGQCIDYEPFRSNAECRGLYCPNGCECYPCECFPKCVNGGLGCCKCGYCCRKTPRCCSYRCKKLTAPCFPGQNACI